MADLHNLMDWLSQEDLDKVESIMKKNTAALQQSAAHVADQLESPVHGFMEGARVGMWMLMAMQNQQRQAEVLGKTQERGQHKKDKERNGHGNINQRSESRQPGDHAG